jgi:hypothetical protein
MKTNSTTNATPKAGNQPWVVVVNAGAADQTISKEAPTFTAALLHPRSLKDPSADVMKRLPDGTLTTEF